MGGSTPTAFDDATAAIAAFCARVGTERTLEFLAPQACDAISSHFVDALGCGLAALDTEPGRIVRQAVAGHSASRGASVFGAIQPSAPEMVAFANTSLVRTLDFNDVYNSRSGGHPSNLFPPILAVAEAEGLSGADVVRGIHAATEVYGALCDAVSLRERGWDAGPFVTIATAAGVGVLLGFGAERIGHAVSLATCSAVHLGVIRAGTLSAWKGCAEGQAVMTGVWLARLAGHGITGPPQPFSGRNGFTEQIVAPLDVSAVGVPIAGRTVLERSAYKFRPVQWTAQAPLEAFVELSPRVAAGEVAKVTVTGSEFMCKAVGGARGDAADKWNPQTRETADHSLPFLAAVALVDGEVTLDSYRPERLRDPALRSLMQRIEIQEDPAIRDLGGGRQPFEIRITMQDGRELCADGEFPHGDWTRPASDAEIDAKFDALTQKVLSPERRQQIRDSARHLAQLQDLNELTCLLRTPD